MRKYFLKESGKNLLDNTLFQSSVSKCVGESYEPMKERMRERLQKSLKHKLIIYKYVPGKGMVVPDFKFANTSGNAILKSKNFKVTKYIVNPELLGKE
jgi:hypothetical protein